MQLLFFGQLADIAGKIEFDLAGIKSTGQLKENLFSRCPDLKSQPFLLAVNKKVKTDDVQLNENDVVALLPPFSGG